jgi:hypothetical protein
MRITRLIFTITVVLGALVGFMAFASVSARAAGRSEINRFGPEGPKTGGFESPQSIAVEQSTGDVYVYSWRDGNVYKFNAQGQKADFSLTGINVIEDVSGNNKKNEIAVGAGAIYVATGEAVEIYNATTGEKTATLTEAGGPCGVAVGPGGDLYVAFEEEERIEKYAPTTSPITMADYESSLWKVGGVCRIAVDSAGDVDAVIRGESGITKYPANQFKTIEEAAQGNVIDSNEAPTFTVDLTNGDVYADNEFEIEVYTFSGVKAETFGELKGESFGVAVNDTSSDVYATNTEENEVVIYGPAAVADDALKVEREGTGAGTVTSVPSGIDCGATCEAEFVEGGTVELTDAPGTGSEFVKWTGCTTTSGDKCDVTMTAAKTVKVENNLENRGGGGTGPAGPPGPPGPVGPTGPTGPMGATGSDGVSMTINAFGPGEHGCADGGTEIVAHYNEATYVCDGANGTDGTIGSNGTNGTNGEKGLPGPIGPVGPAGAQGPAGEVELVTCKTVKKGKKNVQECTTKLVSGTVKLTASGVTASAMLSRHGVVYAAGTARVTHRRTSLRLMPLRRLRVGRYTLTLISGTGLRERVRRGVFTLH